MHRFRLLGPLEVWAENEWQPIGARKWRSLLATLLINANQVVSADTLIDAVWGDNPPAMAANLISIYVLRLRRLIGDPDVVVTRAPGYLLRLVPGDLDSQRFEELVAEGRHELDAGDPERAATVLREALGLWRGDALADVPPSPAIEGEAERLAERRLAATELRIEADIACGRCAQMLPELRAMLIGNQLRERLWLLLMRALDGDGRRAEALEAYAQAREAIADQLGVDPGAELRRTHQILLAADSADARLTYDRSPAGRSGLWVGICGPLTIRQDGAYYFRPLPAGEREVLGLLALSAGSTVGLDSIIAALWPEQDPPPAAASIVHRYVSRLRSRFRLDGDRLISRDSSGYRLHLPAEQIDLLAFRQLAGLAREADDAGRACEWYEQAMCLWRGDPVEDIEVLRTHPAAVALAGERIAVVLGYADRAAVAGRHDMVLPHIKALTAANPLDESLHAALMIAQAGSGRQAEALRVYDDLSCRLREELGIHPGEQLRDAHMQVLAVGAGNAELITRALSIINPRSTAPAPEAFTSPLSTILAEGPNASTRPPGPEAGNPGPGPTGAPLPATNPAGTASREGFGHMLTAVMKRAGLTDAQAASSAGITVATAASWCAGTHLPPLTADGLTALRAILAACGITEPDQMLTWTDALIDASANPAADHQDTAPPDPLQARTPAEFVQALAGFHVWAGKPSLRNMEKACGHQVSIGTMSTAMRGSKLPPLRTVLAIVRGCGGTAADQERFVNAWRKLQFPLGHQGLYPVPDSDLVGLHETTGP